MKEYQTIMQYVGEEYNNLTKEDLKDIFINTLAHFFGDYAEKENIKDYNHIIIEIAKDITKVKGGE